MANKGGNILITTAIAYTNGAPHIGHMYEFILGDFLKRSFQIGNNNQSKETFVQLLTGTDEHGKKIETTAKSLNLSPQTLCDVNSDKFRKLNSDLHVDYDYFIRTTDKSHKKFVQEAIKKSYESGDIYLSEYSGYYNIREECFLSEIEAKGTNYVDIVSGKPFEHLTEESYFFRLEKYGDYIKGLLDEGLVFPSSSNNDGQRLMDLKDLSISRTSFDWGIEFPKLVGGEKLRDKEHVVYVWFDALLNYVSGARKLRSGKYDRTIHLIGKDIVWFHSVIYPAILKSCGYEAYQAENVLVHGFILDKDGVKMSKSLGNVIEVDYLLGKYRLEAIRYYFVMESTWGEDMKFNEERLVSVYNNELIKDFGNLYQRMFSLLKPVQVEVNEYLSGKDVNVDVKMSEFEREVYQLVSSYNHIGYKGKIHELYQSLNKELTEKEPWKSTGKEKIKVLGYVMMGLGKLFILLYPVIPDKIDELRGYMGWTGNRLKIDMKVKVKAFVAMEVEKLN